jgi:hypothetical protein
VTLVIVRRAEKDRPRKSSSYGTFTGSQPFKRRELDMSERERAVHYRELAQQLKRAEQLGDLEGATKKAMLELAGNYDRLADLLDQLAVAYQIETAERFAFRS